MNKKFTFALSAALLASSAQVAYSQQRGEMLERLFSRMDQNKDGFLEQSEAPTEFWSKISNADRNRDGKIDKAEATEGMKSMAGRRGQAEQEGADRGPADSGPSDKDRAKGNRGATGRPFEQEGGEDRVRQLMDKFGKDGKVALDDLPPPLRERLAQLDANDDKIIEQSELKGPALANLLRGDSDNGMMMDRVRRMMQTLDKDGDGKVAIADIPGDFKDRLSKLDKNGDGLLERSEMADLRNIVGDTKGPPVGGMLERMQQMFKQLDKDGDGRVALDDAPAMVRDRWTKLDANNDGMIEQSELKGFLNSDMRPDGKPGDEKTGGGRYGFGSESTAPQAPKRPD